MCLIVVYWGAGNKARRAIQVCELGGTMEGDLLLRACSIQANASCLGFDWPDISGVFAKVREEIGELSEAIEVGDKAQVRCEFGDLIFSVVNLSRFVDACPSAELEAATRRFEERFECLRSILVNRDRAILDCSVDELDEVWGEAKRKCEIAGD